MLVHEKIAGHYIPRIIDVLRCKQVSFRLDSTCLEILQEIGEVSSCALAQPEDWNTEWLSLVLCVKVVKNVDEAVQHINVHSTGHSDGILTRDKINAAQFVSEINSAAVYVDASTRFTDGGQFGLGSEVAVSTQKLHARGPMGLRELTSYKWVIEGDYSIRN